MFRNPYHPATFMMALEDLRHRRKMIEQRDIGQIEPAMFQAMLFEACLSWNETLRLLRAKKGSEDVPDWERDELDQEAGKKYVFVQDLAGMGAKVGEIYQVTVLGNKNNKLGVYTVRLERGDKKVVLTRAHLRKFCIPAEKQAYGLTWEQPEQGWTIDSFQKLEGQTVFVRQPLEELGIFAGKSCIIQEVLVSDPKDFEFEALAVTLHIVWEDGEEFWMHPYVFVHTMGMHPSNVQYNELPSGEEPTVPNHSPSTAANGASQTAQKRRGWLNFSMVKTTKRD